MGHYSRPLPSYPPHGSAAKPAVRQSLERHVEGLNEDQRLREAKIIGYSQVGATARNQLAGLHQDATETLLFRAEAMLAELDRRDIPERLRPAMEALVLKEIEEMAAHIRSGTQAAGWRIVEEVNRPLDTSVAPKSGGERFNEFLKTGRF